ncbi:MAG: hypothetical protein KDD82_27330, partial [Planctomycetes bacterium]|nr:hypothetical protein [Planctomycetota bacterium]
MIPDPAPGAPPRTIHELSAGTQAPSAVPLPPLRWKTRILLPCLLLLTVAGLFLAVSWDSLAPAVPVRVAPVIGKRVEGAVGAATVQAAGWLEPFPYPSYVPALVPGVVEEVLALEGDRVERGQVVARLIDDEARLAADEAAAALEEARAQLASAQANHASAVEANELLIDLTREVAQQAARVAGAQASLAELEARIRAGESALAVIRDEEARTTPLVEGGAVSEGVGVQLRLRLESGVAELEATRRREAVLRAELAMAQAGERAARDHRASLVE